MFAPDKIARKYILKLYRDIAEQPLITDHLSKRELDMIMYLRLLSHLMIR